MIAEVRNSSGDYEGQIALVGGRLTFDLSGPHGAQIRELFEQGIKTYARTGSVEQRALPKSVNWFRAILDQDIVGMGFTYVLREDVEPSGPLSLTCHLIAPQQVDLRWLLTLLSSKRINWSIGPALEERTTAPSAMKHAVKQADFVLAYLPGNRQQTEVWFQVGIAIGLGKSTVILAELPSELPLALEELPVLRVNPDRASEIDPFLDPFLESVRKRQSTRRRREVPATKQGAGQKDLLPLMRSELEQIRATVEPEKQRRLVHLLKRAFSNRGFKAFVEYNLGGVDVIDLAVWVESLESIGGNPLLIEVTSSLSVEDLQETTERFRGMLGERAQQTGLLVYESATPLAAPPKPSLPVVLVLEAADALAAIENDALPQLLLSARNQAVHGVA